MTDAGFFRGTSTEQDVRFSDKDKKLLRTMKFEDCLEQKVDMEKVNFEALKPWVSEQITSILGIEDEVVVELVFCFLEHDRFPNAKKLQILVTGFLQSKPARIFVGKLWELLLSAQENASKLPEKFIEEKKNAIRQQKKKIEMQLNIQDDVRKYSPDRGDFYKHPHHGRFRNASRSPHSRTTARVAKGQPSEVVTQVQKSEASSTQAELEQSASTLNRVENIIKSVEEVIQQNKMLRGTDVTREEHKERVRSRSRSYSPVPPGRRHRSRSREQGDSRERKHRSRSRERGDSRERKYRSRSRERGDSRERHRVWRSSPPHRRHRSSISPFSPDSHSYHQRGRVRTRESPHLSRSLRSPEDRYHQERPVDSRKHTQQYYQGSPIQRQRAPHIETAHESRSAPIPSRTKEPRISAPEEIRPPAETRRSHHHHKPEQEVQHVKKRTTSSRSPQTHKGAKTGRDKQRGKGREESFSSSSSSSEPPSPVRGRGRGGRVEERTRKKSSSGSTSASSDTESDSQDRHRHVPPVAKHKPQKGTSKTSRQPTRVSRKEVTKDTSKKESVQAKRKPQQQHQLSPESGHTSENFSEVEQQRKAAVRAKRFKIAISGKKKLPKERHSVVVKSKVRKVQKKGKGSVERRVVMSKKKQPSHQAPSSDISDESEDISDLEELSRDIMKRKHRQGSPVPAKKARHRKSPTLDSSSLSSESEDSSSSESYSEEEPSKRRRDKRRDKGGGRGRKKARLSEDSSGNESPGRDRGRSSLEKHLRGKMIQAMSKKRLRKNKN